MTKDQYPHQYQSHVPITPYSGSAPTPVPAATRSSEGGGGGGVGGHNEHNIANAAHSATLDGYQIRNRGDDHHHHHHRNRRSSHYFGAELVRNPDGKYSYNISSHPLFWSVGRSI